ncbi:MAG: response regulator transcription factor [Bifidobacteriaceae bacterium]|jgi:two-component system response regulator RegX3|nr:response regulator transcription factor [Bifidobacteriaceae bacterium]
MSAQDRVDCLVVDDEAVLGQATQEYFNMLGTPTVWVTDTTAAEAFLAQHRVGLILLDINLDGESGFAFCRRLRRSSDIPILFISARGGDDDMLLGLGVGADDYIAKPYSLAVLHAKVRAVLRRLGEGAATPESEPDPGTPATPEQSGLRLGQLQIRLDLERVFGPTGTIALTALEYAILARLADSPGQIVPKRDLFTAAWGHTHVGVGTLNVHIRRLRSKLAAAAPGHDQLIRTAWGVGYELDMDLAACLAAQP